MARDWTRRRAALRRLAALTEAVFLVGPCGRAADAPAVPPRVTAMVPLAIPQGFNGTVRLRGIGLKQTTAVRIEGAVQPSTLAIKEKKDAPTPAGIEASLAGDSEVVVELALPAEAPPGALPLVLTAGDQSTAPVVLQICAPCALVAGDPGSGFQNAKQIEPGQTAPGLIGSPREVDVFAVKTAAGRLLRIAITSRGAASLIDPLLTVYDESGRQVAVRDDIAIDNRDAALEITPANDGTIYCVVQDAHDTGSEWHSYMLEVTARP